MVMKRNSSFGIDPERLDRLLAMGLEKSGLQEDMTHTASFDLFIEKPGTQIDRYKLLNVLGEGGMGIVYSAEQQQPIKRQVALKVIKPGMDSKRVIARFEAERQALALLDHPNIAHVYDAGTTQLGRPYFVMEHVKGVPVTEHCDRQKFTIEHRLGLFLQICEAIQHAHQKGIIHRDIKPSNILVSIHGERLVPKVIDFGVAKALGRPLTDRTLETEHGQMVGTPEYMSPEQAEMTNQDVDTRTDIYSLGVLLYKLITGKLPFELREVRERGINGLRNAICEESPKTPSTQVSSLAIEESTKLAKLYQTDVGTLRRRLRGDLDWITLKALEKDRTRRYQTIQAFTEDIQRHLNDEPVLAGPPSKIYRFKKLLRKYRTQFITAALVTVMVALVAVISAMYTHAVSQNREAELLRHNDILSKARQLHTNGKSNEALTELESILNSKHIGLKARLLLAQLTLELKGPAEAVSELEKLLGEQDEIVSQAHFLLARIYLESDPGDPKTTKQYQEKAKEHQQQGEKLFPETAEAYFNRAMLTGNVKKTLEYLNRAVDLDQSYYDARKSRAQAFYTLKNYRRMERDAVAMTALRDWDPLGYSLVAIALRETDDAAEALEYHDKAIRLSPDDPELYQQRYETHIVLEDYQAALKDVQHCIKLDPNNVRYHFQVFCALTALGKYKEAKAEYEKVCQSDSESAKKFQEWSSKYVFDTLDAKRRWHPAASAPDGAVFAAMNEADEYYRTLSQKAVRVVDEGFTSSWAPDGNELVYSRGIVGSSGIEVIHVKTGVTRLLAVPGKDPSWSPDGRYIAYVRDRQVLPLSHLTQERTGVSIPQWQQEVWLVRADGTEEPRFLAKGWFPNWGQDAGHVFYLSEEDARIYRISIEDGAEPEPLVWFPWRQLTVSPSGRHIACVMFDRLYIADLFDKRFHYNLLAPAHTWSVAWTPDEKALILGGDEGLWIYNIQTQETLQLLPGPVTLPRYSRDGRRLAFALWSPYTEIWVADTTTLEPLQTLEQHYQNRITEITRAIEINPEDMESYVSRVRYLGRIGQPEKATADWRRYLELFELENPAGDPMGWGFGLQGGWVTPETAVPIYRALLEKLSENSTTYHFLGLAHCLAGQWEETNTALNESSKLFGGKGRPNAIFQAIAYEQLGNRAEAIRHYCRAVEWMETTRLDVIGSRWNYLRKYYISATQILGVKAKGFRRDIPITGEQIAVSAVRAGSTQTGTTANNIVDGTGLSDQDLDGLLEHDETTESMWLNSQDDVNSWVEFDLGEVHSLGSFLLWNYNERGHPQRGIKQADISVWISETGWQKMFDDFEFAEAEGSFDYDEPDHIRLDGVKAQKVRFDDLVSFANDKHVGLSEVQFFQKRGPEAVRPYPADGADIGTPPDTFLSWTPGIGVKAHRIHFGINPDNLKYMGRFEVNQSSQVQLPDLKKNQTYFWRIDAEKRDGSIIEGKLLTFLTGQMIGWWQFDKTDGKTVFDSSENKLDGKLMGDAHIISDPERDSALSLDGDGDYMYVGNSPLLNFVNSMTLAAWVKVTNSDKPDQDIISKGAGCWRLIHNPQRPDLGFYCCGLHIPHYDYYYMIVGERIPANGRWHHVAGVYDGKTMSIYIDGKLDRSAAAVGTINTRPWPVLIGASPSAVDDKCDWSGFIDDARIYSYALSQHEIAAIYADQNSDSKRK